MIKPSRPHPAFALTALLALAHCASTETAQTLAPETSAMRATAEGRVALSPRSTALATLADSFACMTDATADAARCASLAGAAGVTSEALARADTAATEQVSELARRQARTEQMPALVRTDVLRWFDLAAGAAREAHAAAAGAAGVRITACAEQAGGHPELDALEEASRADTADARAGAQLAALFAFAREATTVAPEAEASALLVLARRVEGARRARAEVRADAAQPLAELVATLSDAPAGREHAERGAAFAREAGAEPGATLVSAQALLSSRLAAVAPRVTAPSLRSAAERAAASLAAARQ